MSESVAFSSRDMIIVRGTNDTIQISYAKNNLSEIIFIGCVNLRKNIVNAVHRINLNHFWNVLQLIYDFIGRLKVAIYKDKCRWHLLFILILAFS